MTLYGNYLQGKKDFVGYDDFKGNFKLNVPPDFNFAYDVVDDYAVNEPTKRALVWVDDNGSEKIFSFKDISVASNKTANFLISIGIKKGDCVMLILRRRYEFWFFMMALSKIGAIAVPCTDQLLEKDIFYRTEKASVKAIVTYGNEKLKKEIMRASEKSRYVEKLVTVEENVSDFSPDWIYFHDRFEKESTILDPSLKKNLSSSDPMLLYFTSGTSGNPKMVVHLSSYPLGHIVTGKFWHGCVEDGLHFTIAETGWGKAIWGKLYGQWFSGCAVFVYDMESFRPDRVLKKIGEYHVTSFCAPPTVYRYLVRQDVSRYDFSSVKRCTTAGETLPHEIFDMFLEQTGIELREGYGQTESTLIAGNFFDEKVKKGSVGKFNPLYDAYIADENGNPCRAGETGEIVIRMPESGFQTGIFAGYYREDELTEKTFSGGIYHTKDNAFMDEDGFVFYSGRRDDVIKSSGYRISPFEVESILMTHPAVSECIVFGVPDVKRGQSVKAVIVLKKGFEPSKKLQVEIFGFVKGLTALYKCPRAIEFAPSLPKTISGKIKRNEAAEIWS